MINDMIDFTDLPRMKKTYTGAKSLSLLRKKERDFER